MQPNWMFQLTRIPRGCRGRSIDPNRCCGWFGSRAFPISTLARVVILGLVCLFTGVARVSGQDTDDVPQQVDGVTVDQQLGAQLPLDLQVTDAAGEQRALKEFFDGKRPVIVTLNYSDCPVLCSVQLNALAKSVNETELSLGEDFQMLTVSIDPQESTERLRGTKELYVGLASEQPGAAEAWHFATADEQVIEGLTDALGFRYKYDAQTKQFNHPAMLAFLSPDGDISSYSLRMDFPPVDLKRSLVAAGNGEVGSPVDQFVIWCFSYDPERGRYVAEAWKLMRAGGLVTIGILAAFLVPYWLGRPFFGSQQEDKSDSVPEADVKKSEHGPV